jgi:hypothetical protein
VHGFLLEDLSAKWDFSSVCFSFELRCLRECSLSILKLLKRP